MAYSPHLLYICSLKILLMTNHSHINDIYVPSIGGVNR